MLRGEHVLRTSNTLLVLHKCCMFGHVAKQFGQLFFIFNSVKRFRQNHVTSKAAGETIAKPIFSKDTEHVTSSQHKCKDGSSPPGRRSVTASVHREDASSRSAATQCRSIVTPRRGKQPPTAKERFKTHIMVQTVTFFFNSPSSVLIR